MLKLPKDRNVNINVERIKILEIRVVEKMPFIRSKIPLIKTYTIVVVFM